MVELRRGQFVHQVFGCPQGRVPDTRVLVEALGNSPRSTTAGTFPRPKSRELQAILRFVDPEARQGPL